MDQFRNQLKYLSRLDEDGEVPICVAEEVIFVVVCSLGRLGGNMQSLQPVVKSDGSAELITAPIQKRLTAVRIVLTVAT